jgi:hypothetical protein
MSSTRFRSEQDRVLAAQAAMGLAPDVDLEPFAPLRTAAAGADRPSFHI